MAADPTPTTPALAPDVPNAAPLTDGTTPAPTSPTAPKRMLPTAIAAAAAVVVVVIVVLALVLSHGGGGGGGGSGLGAATGFNSARSSAASTQSSAIDGPWTLVAAIGVVQPTPYSLTTEGTSGSGCTATSSSGGGLPATVAIDGTSANLTSGLAGTWLLGYNDTAGSTMLVLVDDGVVDASIVEVGPNCGTIFPSGAGPIPTSVIDSPQAAAVAWSNGASAFESQYPNATSIEIVLANDSISGPVWGFEYSACLFAESGAPVTVPEYIIIVNAETGTLYTSGTTTSTTCVV